MKAKDDRTELCAQGKKKGMKKKKKKKTTNSQAGQEREEGNISLSSEREMTNLTGETEPSKEKRSACTKIEKDHREGENDPQAASYSHVTRHLE